MALVRWKLRLLACSALSLAGLVVLLSSQHRLRLTAGSFQTAAAPKLEQAPANNPDFRFLQVSPDSIHSVQDAIVLLARFEAEHPLAAGDAIAVSDDPDTCRD